MWSTTGQVPVWGRSSWPGQGSLPPVVVVPGPHWPRPVPLAGLLPDACVPLVAPGSDPNSG